MSNFLISLSDRLNTPPGTPMHPSSPPTPPPPRLLILSSSESQANRFTTMLLPFIKAVYPQSRPPKKLIPKAPKLNLFPAKPRPDSSHSSYNSRPSLPPELTTSVDLPRRATLPNLYQRRDTWRSPPFLSSGQTPGGGNPSSVSSWFGSWIRKGGPLAVSNTGCGLGQSCSPVSPRTRDFVADPRRESDGQSSPEVDVIKDATGEVIDVKLTTSFQSNRRRSSLTLSDSYDVKRRGSMQLNNVAFKEAIFRVTGFHGGEYHVDYHLQSMERRDEIEADVFRVLKEDILYFFTPPIHAIPPNPGRFPELPRYPPGARKVTCTIADMDTNELILLTVRVDDEEVSHERDILTAEDDRQWTRVQSWAMHGNAQIDTLVKDVLT